mmetsp:Transcript_17163/g.37614  ORF Transcript_17163/g.37614 Transcript_17163/m.37614 type:complete len:124 (+) Transcript_17163:745-1116(+)
MGSQAARVPKADLCPCSQARFRQIKGSGTLSAAWPHPEAGPLVAILCPRFMLFAACDCQCSPRMGSSDASQLEFLSFEAIRTPYPTSKLLVQNIPRYLLQRLRNISEPGNGRTSLYLSLSRSL